MCVIVYIYIYIHMYIYIYIHTSAGSYHPDGAGCSGHLGLLPEVKLPPVQASVSARALRRPSG